MAIVLAPAPIVSFLTPKAYGGAAVTQVPRGKTIEDLLRLASAGAIAFSIAVPLVLLIRFATFQADSNHFPEAAVATALYLPLYVHHVRYGLRGQRPRRLPLTLLAMVAVIVGVTPLLGENWFYAYPAIVASVLVTTPLRFSVPAAACTLAATGIWAAQLPNHSGGPIFGGGFAVYFPLGVAERAAVVFILVWLVGALGRVQSARAALAERALAAERAAVDVELGGTVGAELEAVVAMGVRAEDAFRRGSAEIETELEALVERSRTALANARRVASRYNLASPAVELEKAAALLRAAGIEATIELPDAPLPATIDQSLRSALQVAVAQLLSEEAAGSVVLKLAFSDGRFRLETVGPSKFEPAA